jgi:hypothetical protein
MKMEQSVPKRRYINFRRRGITQKKAYNKKGVIKSVNLFSPNTSEPTYMIFRQAYVNNLPLENKPNVYFMLLKYQDLERGLSANSND